MNIDDDDPRLVIIKFWNLLLCTVKSLEFVFVFCFFSHTPCGLDTQQLLIVAVLFLIL